ncbi:hypothetical protein RB195_024333 [Necator americanus]|uniref:DUF7083 domain-containing protein n=2 Tax=Necator americanus TaxID=51031 RepID=A0ABR1EMQ4_NECAM
MRTPTLLLSQIWVSTRSNKPSSQLKQGHNKWGSRIQKKENQAEGRSRIQKKKNQAEADQGFRRKKTEQKPIKDPEERRPSRSRSRIQKKENQAEADQGFRRKKTKQKADQGFRRKKTKQKPIKDLEERRPSRSRSRIQKKEDRAEADQGSRRKKTEQKPIKDLEERRSSRSRSRIQKKENQAEADQGFRRKKTEQKQRKRVHRNPSRCREEPKHVSKDQYDQLSKDVQMFVSDEEVGHTFAYWYKRYGPVIRDSVLLVSKKRDLILMKLDEDAYRKYADDILPKQPHEIDFETTVANLEKLFASKKTLIRRRYECLRINYPPLTASCVPFRDYANMIKRMDEDARLKKLDYTALKTLQFVAGLQNPSLREVRLRMLRRLDTHTEKNRR